MFYHGDEILGEVPGKYPAYDCSSFSAYYCGILDGPDAKAPSTLHWFLHAIKSGAEKPFSGHDDVWGEILSNWKLGSDKPYRDPLERAVSWVSPEEPTPGMIYVRRVFNPEKVTTNPEVGLYGTGGHMGLIVGVREGQVWILSGNRSMRETPGRDWDFSYALQAQPLMSSLDTGYVYFFQLKDEA